MHKITNHTTHAFETEIGAIVRSDQRCIDIYNEDAPQLLSRFQAKNLSVIGRLCRIIHEDVACVVKNLVSEHSYTAELSISSYRIPNLATKF